MKIKEKLFLLEPGKFLMCTFTPVNAHFDMVYSLQVHH
jgi:hypothetical protein